MKDDIADIPDISHDMGVGDDYPHDDGICVEFDDIDNYLDNHIYGKDFPHNEDNYGGKIRTVSSLRDDPSIEFDDYLDNNIYEKDFPHNEDNFVYS